jgi:uncharacterized SAM-binding protein YcdF (DUF218 family)
MFIVKIIWGIVINLDLILIFILAFKGLMFACRRCCNFKPKYFTGIAFLLLFMMGDWPFSGRDMLRRLENHYATNEITSDVQNMLVLGGSHCLLESEHVGKPVYHKTAGRLIEAMQIAKKHTALKIIFIGSALEGQMFEELMINNNFAKDRFEIITDENIYSLEAAIANASTKVDNKEKKHIIVTSAYQMPRAMQIFHSEKWNVIAHPIDYHTIGHAFDKKPTSFFKRITTSYMDRLGFLSWNIAWREIAGLVNLRLSRKTESIFPK